MAIDPELRAIIEASPILPFDGVSDEEILRARRNKPRPTPIIRERAETKDHFVSVGADAVRVRTYLPRRGRPNRIYLNMHGGGWAIGTLEMNDPLCHHLALEAECLVVSADYRLAPEYPFPVGLNDCLAVLRWVIDNASLLNINPGRLAVGGVSAGANLAGALCLLARDAVKAPIALQLLMCPVCDGALDSPSYRQESEGLLLTAASMAWYWRQYLGADRSRWKDPLASLVDAHDLGGLPKALVLTAEHDVLRDEGEAFAHRLRAAGNSVRLKRYEGAIHAFMDIAPDSHLARQAWADILEEIRRV